MGGRTPRRRVSQGVRQSGDALEDLQHCPAHEVGAGSAASGALAGRNQVAHRAKWTNEAVATSNTYSPSRVLSAYLPVEAGGISTPYSVAIAMTVFTSSCPSETGSVGLSIVGSPISSKKRSCKPPGVWVTGFLADSSPPFL
jgi:hypothetical protein